MARARKLGILTLSSLLWGPELVAQQQLPRIAYDVKECIVKIEVHLTHFEDKERVDDQLRRCFEQSDYCVIGTGVRINYDGDVLTAAHVARDTSVVAETLHNMGIESEVMVAGPAPNAEYVRAKVERMGGASKASIKAIDTEHDVAVLEPEPGGAAFTAVDEALRPGKRNYREVKLDLERPSLGETIFAFGFPEYSPGLVTTMGNITLAYGSTNLLEAKKSGDRELVPVYHAGLEMSPGNSGAPLFRTSDGALRGIVSEIAVGRDVVATIVPASEIAKVLSKYAIKWDAVRVQTTGGAPEKPGHKKNR